MTFDIRGVGERLRNWGRWGAHVCDDYIALPTHCGTHWDALAHFYYEGKLYNGFPSASVGSLGARHGSVDNFWSFFFAAPPLRITRGVGSPVNPLVFR